MSMLCDDVTIVVLPRETLRATGAAVERVRTMAPGARIVAVDVAGQGGISDEARRDPRVTVVVTASFLRPFAAGNLALAHVRAMPAFVVFVDNNAVPAPGCIEALVAAARATGAGCVHPVILFRQGGRDRVHAARCTLEARAHGRLFPRMEDMGEDPSTLPSSRLRDDYGEMHLVLFSRAALDVIAPFPSLSHSEDLEIAMRLRGAGIASVLEGSARATYLADPIRDDLDRAYFAFRWDARAARASFAALAHWPIDDEHWRAKEAWLRRHRRLAHPAFDVALRAKVAIARAVHRLAPRPAAGGALAYVAAHSPISAARRGTTYGKKARRRRQSDPSARAIVVIPARGAVAFVGEAIASARAQGSSVQCVVVAIDGPDAELEAASAGADLVITLPTHAGASAARNAAVREVSSVRAGWLTFLDADDRLRPGAVARLVSAATTKQAVVAYGEAVSMDVDGNTLGPDAPPRFSPRPSGAALRSLLAGNPIATMGAAVIDRAAFASAGGLREDLPYGHDWALWCRLAALGSFAYVGVPAVVERRWHRASISSTLGLSAEPHLRAVDAVFRDPLVVAGIGAPELLRLRRAQEAAAFAVAATERLKLDDVVGARPLLVDALRRRPRVRESVLLACALLGGVPSGVRRRLR
jgi:glycosyltransferase involved in cell wall biosynthesis